MFCKIGFLPLPTDQMKRKSCDTSVFFIFVSLLFIEEKINKIEELISNLTYTRQIN